MALRRVVETGASGLIGSRLVARLKDQGAQVTALTRDPERTASLLAGTQAEKWDPLAEAAPSAVISGADAVFHLAGENVAQRWNASAKQAIRDSRAIGTANLVAGIAAADPRPGVLVSSSAIGYYGPHGEEPLDEEAPPGRDFLAEVCVEWESAANAARQLGVRVVTIRTGVVLDASGGALGKMLPPFKAGVGGPVAGGAQYMPWIHADDVVGIMVAAAEGENWTGAVNATAPEPLTNRDFSKLLGKVLGRPAVFPVPGFAIRAMYGEMAQIVTTGARVMPAKALVNGYQFRYPAAEDALRSALAG